MFFKSFLNCITIDGDDPVSQLVLNNPEMNEFESEILRQATTSKQSAALVLLLLAMCEWMGWAVGCYCSYTMCWCSLKYCIYCYVLCCELYQNAIITPFFSTSCSTINGSQFRRAEVYINLGLENHWPEINAQTSEIGHSWKVLYFFPSFILLGTWSSVSPLLKIDEKSLSGY